MSERPEFLLTATQAAQAAGVSRWAIHRAIKSMSIKAMRDNRNVWRISPDELAAWCAATVAQPLRAQPAAQGELQADALALLRDKLLEAEQRAAVSDARAQAAERSEAAAVARADAAERARDQAEADRDQWRAMADRLAVRRRWWPFG